jgi:REP element-mobilizing transposase RayT
MSGTYTNLIFHIIFSTKHRTPIILDNFKDELHAYIGGIAKGEGTLLLCIGGMPDHLHMMIRIKPIHSLSELMQRIKGKSSKWINQKRYTRSKFYWQSGYGAFSVSESQLSKLKEYIQNQTDHHKGKTFKEEFISILEKHKIEYDSEYIWD